MEPRASLPSKTTTTATPPTTESSSSPSTTAPPPPTAAPPPLPRPASNSSSSSLRTVYIKNLSPTVDSVFLKITCSPYGDVSNVKVIREADGISKGFAFVTFKQAEQAKKAIEMLNGKELDGRILFAGPAIKRATRYHHLQPQQHQHLQQQQQQPPFKCSQMDQNPQQHIYTSTIEKSEKSRTQKGFNCPDATSPKRKRRTVSETITTVEGNEPLKGDAYTKHALVFPGKMSVSQHHQSPSPTEIAVNNVNFVRQQAEQFPHNLNCPTTSIDQGGCNFGHGPILNLRHVEGSPFLREHQSGVASADTVNPVPLACEDLHFVESSVCSQQNFFLPHIASSQAPSTEDSGDVFHLPQIRLPKSQQQQQSRQPQYRPAHQRRFQQSIESACGNGINTKQKQRKSSIFPPKVINVDFPPTCAQPLPQIGSELSTRLPLGHLPQRQLRPEDRDHNSRKRRRARSLQPFQGGQAERGKHCFAQKSSRFLLKGCNFERRPPGQLESEKQMCVPLRTIDKAPTIKEILPLGSYKTESQACGCNQGLASEEHLQHYPQEGHIPGVLSQGKVLELKKTNGISKSQLDKEGIKKPDNEFLYSGYQFQEQQNAASDLHVSQDFHKFCYQQQQELFFQQQQQQQHHRHHHHHQENVHKECHMHEQCPYYSMKIADNIYTASIAAQESFNAMYATQNMNSTSQVILPVPHSLQFPAFFNSSTQEIPQPLPPASMEENHPYQCNQPSCPVFDEKSQSLRDIRSSSPTFYEASQSTDLIPPHTPACETISQPAQLRGSASSSTNETTQFLPQMQSLDPACSEQEEVCYDDCSSPWCGARKDDQNLVCNESDQDTTQSSGAAPPQGINLYVKHLSEDVDDVGLKEMFSKFGEVISAKVMMEGERSRGFGFVCFQRAEDAARATRDMRRNVDDVNKRHLYVAPAQRKEERQAFFREKLKAKRRDVDNGVVNMMEDAKTDIPSVVASSAQNVSNLNLLFDGLTPVLPKSSLNMFKWSPDAANGQSGLNWKENLTKKHFSGQIPAVGPIAPGKRKIQTLFSKRRKSNLSSFDCFNVEKLRTPLIKPSKLGLRPTNESCTIGSLIENPGEVLGDSSGKILFFKESNSGFASELSAWRELETDISQWGSPHGDCEMAPFFAANVCDKKQNCPAHSLHSEARPLAVLTPIGCSLKNSSSMQRECRTADDISSRGTGSFDTAGLAETEVEPAAPAPITLGNTRNYFVSEHAYSTHFQSGLKNFSTARHAQVTGLTHPESCALLSADSENKLATDSEHHQLVTTNGQLLIRAEEAVGLLTSTRSSEKADSVPFPALSCHPQDASLVVKEACKADEEKRRPEKEISEESRLTERAHRKGAKTGGDVTCVVSQDASSRSVSRRDLKRSRESMEKEQDEFGASIQRYLDSVTDDPQAECPHQPKRRMLDTEASDKCSDTRNSLSLPTGGVTLEEMLAWPVESQKASLAWMVCTGVRDLLEEASLEARRCVKAERYAGLVPTLNRLFDHSWTLDSLVDSLVAMAMELDVVEILNLLQSKDCLEIMVNQGLVQLWNFSPQGSVASFDLEGDSCGQVPLY